MGGVPVASICAREFPRTRRRRQPRASAARAPSRTAPKSPSNFKDPGSPPPSRSTPPSFARWRASREPSFRFEATSSASSTNSWGASSTRWIASPAASAERFAAAYAVDGGAGAGLAGLVRAPRIVPELSTRAVLVMEWIDGARLTDVDALFASGLTPGTRLDRGVRCSRISCSARGFMHSDPHPGNLVVARDGALVYLDFGMVVEIPETARRAMIRGLVGFVNRDAASLVDDLADLRFLPETTNRAAAAEALAAVFHGVAGDATGDSETTDRGSMPTGSAVRGTNDFLGVVSQLTARRWRRTGSGFRLFREGCFALAALEGTATGIDPNFKVIERAYPHVLARVVADRSPEMRDVLRRLVLEEDGASVRWNRVRRVASAFAAASAAEDHASDEEDTKKTETKEEKETCAMTRAVTDAVRCAAETAAGAAIGARGFRTGNLNERRARMTTRIPRRRRRLFETPRGTSYPRGRGASRGDGSGFPRRERRGDRRARGRDDRRGRGGGV